MTNLVDLVLQLKLQKIVRAGHRGRDGGRISTGSSGVGNAKIQRVSVGSFFTFSK